MYYTDNAYVIIKLMINISASCAHACNFVHVTHSTLQFNKNIIFLCLIFEVGI